MATIEQPDPQLVEEFSQVEEQPWRRRALGFGLGVAATAGVVAAQRYGVGHEVFDALTLHPQPGTHTEIVDTMITSNNVMRWSAVAVPVGALATGIYYKTSESTGSSQEALNDLVHADLSGNSRLVAKSHENGLLARLRAKNMPHALDAGLDKMSRFRRWSLAYVAGTGIAVSSIAFIGASSGTENEVSNGPLRPVEAMYGLLAPGATNYDTILQSSKISFMDKSAISQQEMQTLKERAAKRQVKVSPFMVQLMEINDGHAIEISIPDQRFEQLTGEKIDNSCNTVPAIIDNTAGVKEGENFYFNDAIKAKAVKVEKGLAQMNRSIAFLSQTDMTDCVLKGGETNYFGAIVSDESTTDGQALLNETGDGQHVQGAALTTQEVEDVNREFWRMNGTPILLVSILGGLGFSAVAVVGAVRANLLRNLPEISILRAEGFEPKDISAWVRRKAFWTSAKATPLAMPLMYPAAAVLNMAEKGLRVGVGARELFVGAGLTWAAQALGGWRAARKFNKNLRIDEGVKS